VTNGLSCFWRAISIGRGEIVDAKTIVALYRARDFLARDSV
jgi:hypothetical protein